jgi:hypothetical protein
MGTGVEDRWWKKLGFTHDTILTLPMPISNILSVLTTQILEFSYVQDMYRV